MKKKTFLGSVAVVLLLSLTHTRMASAERIVTALPHAENFDANNYSELVWTTNGATHTWLPAGGFRGGAAKFTPCLTGEGYSGLGSFVFRNIDPMPAQLNVRFLIYHGSTWREHGPGNKLIIMNREGNRGRPMIITRKFEGASGSFETWGACDGTVCRYDEGDYWPLGGDRLRIGNAPNAREEQWISLEFEANVVTGIIKLYVDTLDRQLSGLYIERPMDDTGTGGTWSYIDIIGGYMAAATQSDPNSYFLIDELQIASNRIGPPTGFGTTPPQGPGPGGGTDAGSSSGSSGSSGSNGAGSGNGTTGNGAPGTGSATNNSAAGASSSGASSGGAGAGAGSDEGCNTAHGGSNGVGSVVAAVAAAVTLGALRRRRRR